MIVFHGSNVDVMEIDLSKSRKGLDFGRGFYVTVIREQAEEWAMERSEKYGDEAIVSEFEFNYENVFKNSHYDTKRYEKYDDEWLDFIIENRINDTNTNKHTHDIIESPLADDKVTIMVQQHIDSNYKNPTREELLDKLKFEKPTHQICFCTTQSLDTIRRVNLENLPKIKKIGSEVVNYLVKKDGYAVKDAYRTYHNSDIYNKLSSEKSALHYKYGIDVYLELKDELAKQQTLPCQEYNKDLNQSL